MTSPETSPVLRSFYAQENKSCSVYGIRQESLSETVIENVLEIYDNVVGSPICDKWIFHSSRIQNELRCGRNGLAITFITGIGAVTLSVEKIDGLLVFDLNSHSDEKPDKLRGQYQGMEEQFGDQVSACFQELGIAEPVI